jgi:4-amino-4-deoxy-L-arabinose transferase-like glycosyltransferase
MGDFAGLVAGLMQASFAYVVMQARLAEADMPMCAAVVLAMSAFARAVVYDPATSRRRPPAGGPGSPCCSGSAPGWPSS